MGQVLRGCATTTHAVRAALQRSKASLKELAAQHGLNPKTVAKWRKRAFVHDAAMGPKTPRSTVLTTAEEAIITAFRRHALLPLDDCLYALQSAIPHLTASAEEACNGVRSNPKNSPARWNPRTTQLPSRPTLIVRTIPVTTQ